MMIKSFLCLKLTYEHMKDYVSLNGPRAMLFLPGRLQGRGPYGPPPGKPIRTYPFGVKITRGVESANLSTEMQS